ncbi:MAG TPA: polysaccharide deacetylase family protein, partial [Smithellaceae bacterium]|nr:polysaccharide deacetylase family protein [Smithellaceae bacterium]
IKPKQGIFYDGQIFDAYKFVADLIRTARKSIIVIDNYVDDAVLTLLSKAGKKVKITILTKTISKQLVLDVKKYNEQYPEIIKEIINRGHTVGNHSFHHDPFLMLKSSRVIYQEILTTQELLKKLGVQTFAFRPPVGIVNPGLASLLKKLNMDCIIFSCRAVDRGNRRVKHLSRKFSRKLRRMTSFCCMMCRRIVYRSGKCFQKK